MNSGDLNTKRRRGNLLRVRPLRLALLHGRQTGGFWLYDGPHVRGANGHVQRKPRPEMLINEVVVPDRPLARSSVAGNDPQRRWRAALAALLLLATPLLNGHAAADSPANAVAEQGLSADQRRLAELRDRQKFDLAATYCKERLGNSHLPPRQRAELAGELVRTYALAAVAAKPTERPLWWHRAHRVVVDFTQRSGISPFAILVQFEDAVAWIDQGEVERAEGQWHARPPADRSTLEPRTALRAALRALARLEADLATAQRRVQGPAAGPGLSREEIAALQKHVAYQTARARIIQGQCYAAGTPDRANSLQQALERLTPLAELPVADRLIWRCRVERVACYRLLGKTAAAEQLAKGLLDSHPPPAITDALRGEQIRARLAAGQVDQALAAAETAATTTGRDGGNLELARLEAMIAAWQLANRRGDAPTAGRLASKAADQVRQIERQFGPHAARRAETMLAHSMGSGGGVNLGALTRAAQGFYRSGDVAQAEATYDRIAQLANDQEHADQAFRAAFTAATIEHDLAKQGSDAAEQLEHHRRAMQRYGKTAAVFSSQPRAAEADLLAIYHAAEIARLQTGADRQVALEQYATKIDDHLKRWPQGAAAGQVRLWLGRLRQAQRRWAEAIAAYRAIPADDPHFDAAVQAIVPCYDQWQADKKTAGEDARPVAQAATACYRQLLVGLQRPNGPAGRVCGLAVAKLLLQRGDSGCREAQQVLTAALAEPPSPPDNWQAEARGLLVLALVGRGKITAAQTVLEQISTAPGSSLVALVERLAQRAQRLPTGPNRRAAASLAIRAARIVPAGGHDLPADLARRLQTARATALAAAGRRREAISGYTALAEEDPKDAEVQQALAQLLGQSKDPRELKRALAAWQAVQRLSPVASPRWFRARYGQAEVLAHQGAKAKAAKLIAVTQVLHPSLGGPTLRRKFEQLLDTCRHAAASSGTPE